MPMKAGESKHFVHRLVYLFASSVMGAKVFSVIAPPLDRLVVKLSRGKSSASQLFSAESVYTLTSVGAKSGLERETTLFGVADGNNVIFIASNWGKAKYPGWYHNLKANPKASISFSGITSSYVAHEAKGEEREEKWSHVTSVYDIYENYVGRTGGRVIPVMIMRPLKK
jgi:deazaflavin-dependent oxidoreductase (nitroreductase family)